MATWGAGISLKGQKGDRGLDVLTGNGAPTGTATETQAYVDVQAGQLYRYTNGAWVAGKSLVGPMGINALNAQLLHGVNPPDENTFNNDVDALYIQYTGEVWYFDFEGSKTWTDSGQNLTGPKGADGVGKDGLRGTQIYDVQGPPSSDPTSFTPTAAPGDYAIDMSAGPTLYRFA